MFTVPKMPLGPPSRLVFALAVAVPLIVAAVASVPALLVLPFFPTAADRADRLIRRLTYWTIAVLLRIGDGHR